MSAPAIDRPVIIVGAGGHAKVLTGVLRCLGAELLGAVDTDPAKAGDTVLGVAVLGGDECVLDHDAGSVLLANGIGSIRLPERRAEVFERFAQRGYGFVTAVHPSAVIAEGARLGEGAQIMAGAVVQSDAAIGRDAIMNTGATIDHDCVIGDHVHVAPGATLSGNVTVGAGSHVGAGATIVQGVTVGRGCLVRAGAVVVSDVPDGATVSGVPARAA